MTKNIIEKIELEAPVKRFSPSAQSGVQIGYNRRMTPQGEVDYAYEDVLVMHSGERIITEVYCPFQGSVAISEGLRIAEIQYDTIHLLLLCQGGTVEFKKEGRSWDKIFKIGASRRRLDWDFGEYEGWGNTLTLAADLEPASLEICFSCSLIIQSEREEKYFPYVLFLDSTHAPSLLPSIDLWL